MVLRSTGKVKRGLGTIRQDVNISIAAGARVEIKGVQELDLIAEVVRREVQRQQSLLAIRDELRKRGASVDAAAGHGCHRALQGDQIRCPEKGKEDPCHCPERICRPCRARDPAGAAGSGARCRTMPRSAGSAASSIPTNSRPTGSPQKRSHTSAPRCMPGNRTASSLLPVRARSRHACAISQVITRAQIALADKPVPEETRKMLESGSTAYMRPLPGAARMYPETDVLPVLIDDARWEAVTVPELLTAKAERFRCCLWDREELRAPARGFRETPAF